MKEDVRCVVPRGMEADVGSTMIMEQVSLRGFAGCYTE